MRALITFFIAKLHFRKTACSFLVASFFLQSLPVVYPSVKEQKYLVRKGISQSSCSLISLCSVFYHFPSYSFTHLSKLVHLFAPLSCSALLFAVVHDPSIGSASTQPAPKVWLTIQHCLVSQKPVGTRPKAKQLYADNARTVFHSPGSCMSMVKVMQKILSNFQKYLVSPVGKEKKLSTIFIDKLSWEKKEQPLLPEHCFKS